MKIRRWAQCTSSLPTDEVESEDGTYFVQHGGKSVAEAIAEDLRGIGCIVESPEYAGDHGWECGFKFQDRPMWFQVTLIHDYLLLFVDGRNSNGNRPHHPIYVDFMRQIGSVLRADDRLENLRWYEDDGPSDAKGTPRSRYR